VEENRADMKKPFALKRSFDIAFSLSALSFGFPLFILIGLLVKLTSTGPIFYSSMRLGERGTLFKFWKFRSMQKDADERLKALLQSNPALALEWQTYFKLKEDPRLTKIGKFLRKTSLDELPQFWSVLTGDLSIVGPRPYLPREKERIHQVLGNDTAKLFSVKPGLTGIWQTSGRNHLTFEERVKLDFSYIEKRSFLLDIKLIAKTIPILFFPKGSF
jgi:exopolysaccharide production protein ExoY